MGGVTWALQQTVEYQVQAEPCDFSRKLQEVSTTVLFLLSSRDPWREVSATHHTPTTPSCWLRSSCVRCHPGLAPLYPSQLRLTLPPSPPPDLPYRALSLPLNPLLIPPGIPSWSGFPSPHLTSCPSMRSDAGTVYKSEGGSVASFRQEQVTTRE